MFEKKSELIKFMEDLKMTKDEFSHLGQRWDFLTILSQITGSSTSMSGNRESFFKLSEQLLNILCSEKIQNTVMSLTGEAQFTIDIIIRNLFERTADIGFLATDEDIRQYIKVFNKQFQINNNEDETIINAKEKLKTRFAEYVAKYSVYSNIILFRHTRKSFMLLARGY